MFEEYPHILVIDDDQRIRDLIMKYLWKHDFVALGAPDAETADRIMRDFEIDLIVCDIMMPKISGLEYIRQLRANRNKIPLILLTALGETEHRIDGLESGADDYLAKPFDPKELVLRIKSLLRRTPKKNTSEPVRIGRYTFLKNGQELTPTNPAHPAVKLTDIETRLLNALLTRPETPLSRAELAKMCDMNGSDRAIDVQITRLRKKIEHDPAEPQNIKTIRGKGYMLKVEN